MIKCSECRRIHKRCDDDRPCKNCKKRNKTCVDEDKSSVETFFSVDANHNFLPNLCKVCFQGTLAYEEICGTCLLMDLKPEASRENELSLHNDLVMRADDPFDFLQTDTLQMTLPPISGPIFAPKFMYCVSFFKSDVKRRGEFNIMNVFIDNISEQGALALGYTPTQLRGCPPTVFLSGLKLDVSKYLKFGEEFTTRCQQKDGPSHLNSIEYISHKNGQILEVCFQTAVFEFGSNPINFSIFKNVRNVSHDEFYDEQGMMRLSPRLLQ